MKKQPLLLSLTLLILLSFGSNLHAQVEVKTGFELTNAKPPKNTSDSLFYKYIFPKKYERFFYSISDTAFMVRIDKETEEESTRILMKKELRQHYRSPMYGFLINICALDQLDQLKPHTIEIVSRDGKRFTSDKITEKDIKKIRKIYAAPSPAKNTRKKLKKFSQTGNAQGELMGANRNIRIVKRKKCSVKKKEYRKNGINGVKEMTTGF